MPRVSLVLCAFLASAAPAFAATNPTAAKLAAFKDTKAKLQGDIDLFLREVQACSPPFGQSQIQSGFGNMADPKSAKSLLNAHEQRVTQSATTGDQTISVMEKGVLGCSDPKPIIPKAGAVAKSTQQDLEIDRQKFQTGADVVNSKRGLILQVLGMGGDQNNCSAATRQMDVMAADTKLLQARLIDLEKSFADRVLFLQAKAIAPGACVGGGVAPAASSPIHKAIYESGDEDMMAEQPLEQPDYQRDEESSATIAI